DPAIPIVGVAGSQIDELGWCAPADGPAKPLGPIVLTMWRLDGPAAVAVPLRLVAPTSGQTRFAALYREVTDCVGSLACSRVTARVPASTWLAGRYIFEYADRGSGITWWFGADVQVLPPPTVAPTPSAPSAPSAP